MMRTLCSTTLVFTVPHALFLLASGCADQPSPQSDTTPDQLAETEWSPQLHFTDITSQIGLNFITTSGEAPSTAILEVNGCGLALIDYDNDGDQDLFIANGATLDDTERGPGSRMYRNDLTETGSLRFTDVSEELGLHVMRWTMGVAVGDVNADGFDDLYLTCFGPNILLINRGGTRFEDTSRAAGVDDAGWGTSAAFGDLDRDGDLDLYVVNYLHFDPAHPPPPSRYKDVEVLAGPHGLPAQHDVLYRNRGDGTFENITDSAGCRPPAPAFGLNVVMLDVDHDGWQDIFVANDSMPNFLWRNQSQTAGELQFEDDGMRSGVASNIDGSNQATMGIGIADVDGNGFADIFTSNFSSDTNTLHLNDSGRFFDDRTAPWGLGMISRPYLGWGCGFADFDHDGDEDLLLMNGHVYPQATRLTMDSDYAQPPLLFAREASRFDLIDADRAGAWLAEAHRDRTIVFGDLDRDGDLDAVIGELNGPVRVLRNDVDGGPWLIVELRDERPNTGNHRGIGTRIELTAASITQTRWLVGGESYQSSSEPIAHFAISDADQAVLSITWPDDEVQRLDLAAPFGRRIVVTRP